MAKYHQIKWKSKDHEELTKAVRNFNAKIKRIEKKNPQIKNALPDKLSVKQLKELINTRQDLKREINALKRFTKRGAEELEVIPNNDNNLLITKWQRKEINRRIGIINRRREKRLNELENIEMTSRGDKLGYTKGDIGMGKITKNALKPMQGLTKSMDRRDLQKKWKVVMNESQSDFFSKRDFRVKETFINTLLRNYNEEDIKDVIDYIRKIDIKEFLEKFESEGGAFDPAYPPDEEQYKSYVMALKAAWIPKR